MRLKAIYAKHITSCTLSVYLHLNDAHFDLILLDETIIINIKPFLIYLLTSNMVTHEKNGREFFLWMVVLKWTLCVWVSWLHELQVVCMWEVSKCDFFSQFKLLVYPTLFLQNRKIEKSSKCKIILVTIVVKMVSAGILFLWCFL